MAEIKYYTYVDILRLDMGKQTFDTDSLRHLVAEALTQVPADIVDKAYKDCYFLTADPEIKGAHIPKDIIQNRDIIVLSRGLYKEPFEEQSNVILHEVAHYVFAHKPLDERLRQGKLNPMELVSSEKSQEAEAEALKDKWLADYSKSHKKGVV